jgi:Uma2 family endonuclease
MTTTVRWTTEQYDRLAELGVLTDPRVELVGGELIQMPPIGTAHMLVVTALQRYFLTANAEGRLLIQQPLVLGVEDEPQPDLTVLRAPVRRKPTAQDCELVIEVSDSTLSFDRTQKLPRYLLAGCPEVWIVNIADRSIEIYRNGSLQPAIVRAPYGAAPAAFKNLEETR